MKYTIHDTEALVLRRYPLSEDSVTVHLLTREFGCLYVRVQGARKATSRQRAGLIESSHISIGLMAGKGGWRAAHVVPHSALYTSFRGDPHARAAMGRILFACRYLISESSDAYAVFDVIRDGLYYMTLCKEDKEQLHDSERITMWRMLYALGYVKGTNETLFLAREFYWNKKDVSEIRRMRKEVTREINKALSVAY